MKRILIVEDDDVKWRHIRQAVDKLQIAAHWGHATSVLEAERYLDANGVDILLLDISMNVSAGDTAMSRGGHANLGGVEIAERLWLLGMEMPTIILTGFDYFRSPGHQSQSQEIYNLEGLERRVRSFMGEQLLACIKYGGDAWERELLAALSRALDKQ